MEMDKKQSKKRKNNQSEKIQQQVEKQHNKKVQKQQVQQDSDDDYEDCMSEEEDIQVQQFQQPQKKSKNTKRKRVTFNEEEDDIKNNVDIHDLKYEDDHYDEYDQENIEEDEEQMGEGEQQGKSKVFLGTDKDLKEDEELEFDNRAYEMFHRGALEWPCLSCDFLLNQEQPYYLQNPGYKKMEKYPYEAYLTAGTQTGNSENFIYLMRLSNLVKTKYDDDSDYQGSDDGKQDNDEPQIRMENVPIKNNVNRIRSMQHMPIVAYWQDNGDLSILDMKKKFNAMVKDEEEQIDAGEGYKINKSNSLNSIKCNVKTFKNTDEGYGLDWSYLKMGYLLSGSCDGKIYLYQPKNENLSDIVRQSNPFLVHNGSVEDLQWSPKDDNEFASCGIDGTVQVTDIRTTDRKKSQIKINAHDVDVNVISWCRSNTHLIASGADNGEIKIWDKRYPQNPYTEIDFHKEPITSLQFQPNDESTLSASSADNRLTIWDFGVENDDNQDLDQSVPDQLMFIHQGQKEMKELRYHPIYHEMIVCTALDSVNVFKPALDVSESSIRSDSVQDQDEIVEINEKDLDKCLGKLSLNN